MILQQRVFQEIFAINNPNWFNDNGIAIISDVDNEREICKFLLSCAIVDGLGEDFLRWLDEHYNNCHFAIAENDQNCYAVAFENGNKAVYACSIEDPFNEELF